MEGHLTLENLSKRFGSHRAVDGTSLQIARGEAFSLVGPSGCGKTTLLRMIAGFEQPDAGRILLDGKDLTSLPPEKRPVNTVFQNYALFPHLSVEDNIAFGPKMAGSAEQRSSRPSALSWCWSSCKSMPESFLHSSAVGSDNEWPSPGHW